ncbi:putative monooxygenase, FAD-binding protein [Streptomyces albospinus]|uniref:Monooxygenase, FAD-binding protein n=1 Tax=Streptomyces albospinus TaxID=285515 RepID=A0ABQ2VNI5_9ACTN|nr:FAD-dependent oxidoreductase [Streptomyces albospinus]GGU96362.1 putative monooxygenase, FAD-binding protein [Streptomyces albospinus]
MERTTCCVVGGGPSGMMLGLLLARAGIEVTVLEKHGDFLRDFRGDTVHPSTLNLLDDLGLGDEFARLPFPKLEEMRAQIGDTTVVMADMRRIPGRHKYFAMVPQWDFLDLIAGAAAEEPSFTLRMRTRATGLLTDGGRVTGVRYVDEDGTAGELAADLTVACDGRDSLIRQAAGMHQRHFEVPMDVWQIRVDAPTDGLKGGRVFGRFGGGQAAVTMDRGTYFQTSYLIGKGQDAALRRHDIQWLRDRLGALFGWDDAVTGTLGSWDDVKLLEVTFGRLRRWHRPGLLCIGDAAHTMSPVGGVGVNLALQDAVAAARILAGPLRRGTVGTEDLTRVQKRREWPMAVVQKSQASEHAMIRSALNGTLHGDRLPVPMKLLRRIPALRTVTGYLGGVGIRPEPTPDFARVRTGARSR